MCFVLRLYGRADHHVVVGDDEFDWLVDFVREGLLDRRARPERLRNLVPQRVPSGRPTLIFQFQDSPDTG